MDELVVATDSPLVGQVVERSGVRAVLTSRVHLTGTDRVAEVAAKEEFAAFDTIVNVQGDEPFLAREALAGAIERVAQGDDIGTAAPPLDPRSPATRAGKVVTDARGGALYFSRAAIRTCVRSATGVRGSIGGTSSTPTLARPCGAGPVWSRARLSWPSGWSSSGHCIMGSGSASRSGRAGRAWRGYP